MDGLKGKNATWRYICYHWSSLEPIDLKTTLLPAGYRVAFWRPEKNIFMPKGLPIWPFFVWWLFDFLHFFYNRDYSIVLIYQNSELVHRSVVFPGFFRFPFMQREDLQIGDTWTHPAHRGKGLAKFALAAAVNHFHSPNRGFWYIVEERNIPSIKVVESVGFQMVGRCKKVPRFGSLFLGYYQCELNLTQKEG